MDAAATASQTKSSMLENVTMCRLSQPTLGLANLTLFPSSDIWRFDPKLNGNLDALKP